MVRPGHRRQERAPQQEGGVGGDEEDLTGRDAGVGALGGQQSAEEEDPPQERDRQGSQRSGDDREPRVDRAPSEKRNPARHHLPPGPHQAECEIRGGLGDRAEQQDVTQGEQRGVVGEPGEELLALHHSDRHPEHQRDAPHPGGDRRPRGDMGGADRPARGRWDRRPGRWRHAGFRRGGIRRRHTSNLARDTARHVLPRDDPPPPRGGPGEGPRPATTRHRERPQSSANQERPWAQWVTHPAKPGTPGIREAADLVPKGIAPFSSISQT